MYTNFAITFIGSKLDLWIIIIYFLLIMGFGSLFARFTKSTKDFFFGGQRFSWWLISMSCVATLVGSYSFIKYAAAGYSYGMASSMTYLNDWFIMPLFIFGWLPIIYFSRVTSIPEYFEKRFGNIARLLATILIMVYLMGYIGINFLTLGVALNKLLGIELYTAVIAIAVVSAVYVTAGGQTAVIMTDLAQALILLAAGFALFFLGLSYLGGFGNFWHNLPVSHRLPFSGVTSPEKFPGGGIFWQDAIANSMAFYFMNQGLIMRFLSVKSVRDGRKAVIFMVLVLMPFTAIAVSNVGWIGKAMPQEKLLEQEYQIEVQIAQAKGLPVPARSQNKTPNPNDVFVTVSKILCIPGVFGFIMAALTAALMSTVDTLINATSAIWVNDIWRLYIKRDRPDSHYLFTARWFSVVATVIGVLLVPIFAAQKSLYAAHGMFTAAVTPPMVAAIVLGAFWKRFSNKAVIATLIGGSLAIIISFIWEEQTIGLQFFSWGIGPGGYKFMRAFYGLVVCFGIGIVAGLLTRPADINRITGYVCGTLKQAAESYKGGPLTGESNGVKVAGRLVITDLPEGTVRLSQEAMHQIDAQSGDMIYVCDKRAWLGGIRSTHLTAGPAHDQPDQVWLAKVSVDNSNILAHKPVTVEKII